MREASSETLTLGSYAALGFCELVEGLSEITTFGVFITSWGLPQARFLQDALSKLVTFGVLPH